MPLQGYREARHLIVSKQQLLNLARRSGALPTSARHPSVVQSPFRHSHAWPSTYDSKHIGLLGSVGVTEYALRDISISGMISRGFRTRAPTAHKTFCGAKPPAATEVQPLSDGAALTEHRNVEPSREDQARMRAFAEGYHEGKATAPSSWSLISIARDFFVLSLFTAIAMYMFYGSKFKTLIIGPQNEVKPQEIDVRFDDVIGVEETKQELEDVVDFLKNPKKFSNLGGRLPKGVLLVGPPGTGKTLLARAVAGEAGVPFFHAAGPEFDEMLVGQGARRMRDLFSMAKARAPCVIFIDEIDSVGGKRSNSTLHPYANQTINQLLSEMDGFRQNEGVIVLGATNRRDDLDQALLRPGRFDIEVQVPPPDIVGRTELLEYYLSKVKVDKDVDVKYLARGTTGFTGAAIENMVNQAALRSAIDGKDSVSQAYLEDARDKMLMGPERKNRVPDYEDNLLTAYHEAGHTLVAYYSEGAMPIHKVTIRARGSAVGHTAFIPSKDESYLTKSQILARIAAMLGGKVAEEMVFGSDKVTTGASSDLQNATELATSMIKHWGMSDKVGDRFFKPTNDSLFAVNDLSNSTSEAIDQEIKRTLQESKMRAMDILKTHHAKLKLLAEALMEYETLDAKQVKRLLETGSLAQ